MHVKNPHRHSESNPSAAAGIEDTTTSEKKRTNPSISIVVCTYNNATMLDRTLFAVENLTTHPLDKWEVLVVNNNCTDDTRAVVDNYRLRNSRFRLIYEYQQGLTPARLCGVKNSTQDWIAFVDDDCVLDPGWLQSAILFAESNPDAAGFGGKVSLNWETQPPSFVNKFHYCFAEQELGSEQTVVDQLVGAGMVVNRKLLEKSGWVQRPLLDDRVGKQLVSGGDVEIAVRLRAISKLWYVPTCSLSHVIPNYRTTVSYLMRINFGLGRAQYLSEALVWDGTNRRWIKRSVRLMLSKIRLSISCLVRALLGKQNWAEARIAASFHFGWCVGACSLLALNIPRREDVLGAIKRMTREESN